MKSSATISSDGLYRYRLERSWNPKLKTVAFIMLNPSTADAASNDPTLERCIGFANRWGFGSLIIGNLFAFRTKSVRLMKQASDPIGIDNDDELAYICKDAFAIICAWGANGGFRGRDQKFCNWVELNGYRTFAIRLTAKGAPEHPLYIPYGLNPVPYVYRR